VVDVILIVPLAADDAIGLPIFFFYDGGVNGRPVRGPRIHARPGRSRRRLP
jgi:hypothetical protein